MIEGAQAKPDRAVLRRSAWAKVNLYLHVTGRRPDGYHELDSLIVFAAVGDRLTFAPAPDLVLELTGGMAGPVPSGAENLVLRAAEALRRTSRGKRGARIRLRKLLPSAAGLGGGSADAAATLDGLVRLWALDPAALPLSEIALELGADVPICRYGRPAFVSGLGERIRRAPPLPPAWLLLVNPGVPLSTPGVFRARAAPFSEPAPWDDVIVTAADLADRLKARRNDLEPPARGLAPAVGRVLACLGDSDGCLLARMSGSGATCFGLFASGEEAGAALTAIEAAEPTWWIARAPMLHGRLDSHWEPGCAGPDP